MNPATDVYVMARRFVREPGVSLLLRRVHTPSVIGELQIAATTPEEIRTAAKALVEMHVMGLVPPMVYRERSWYSAIPEQVWP